MDEKDIKCGYSTIVKINRELEELKGKVAKLESGEVDAAADLKTLTVSQLREMADVMSVDLGAYTLKADIIDAIEAAQAE